MKFHESPYINRRKKTIEYSKNITTSVSTGVAITASTVKSVPTALDWSLPLPGPISGPITQITSGSAITVTTTP